MAISRNKTRMQISLTDAQIEEIERASQEMGITKSDLISIATMQYIRSYELSKDVAKTALTDAIKTALEKGEIDIERLKELQR